MTPGEHPGGGGRGGLSDGPDGRDHLPAFYEPAIFTMNGDLYESLSPDLRETVDRCARQAMADQRLRNREQEADILERWQEENGIAVHVLTDAQCGAFQALTDRLYDPEDPDHQEWFADCTPEWVAQFRALLKKSAGK